MSCVAGLISYSAPFLVVMFCAATLSAAPMLPAAPTQAQITVLYDAFSKSSDMHKDWGYAALVEYGGKRILFDTGAMHRVPVCSLANRAGSRLSSKPSF